MSGTLFVVATPIGNLEDITFRAVRVLREADVIAAEDTRRTAKLLARHGLATPLLSFHAHNVRTRLPQILARLEKGQRVAVVTDAGTPGVSDPGIELVQACLAAGIAVEPVPGPTAPLTAAVASGFPLEPLTIFGFAPYRSKDRTSWLRRVLEVPHTFTFFEAPHRIRQTLLDLSHLSGIRQICLGRELTKAHQQFIRGDVSHVIGQLTQEKGEFTVVVGPPSASEAPMVVADDLSIWAEFGRMDKHSPGGRRRKVQELATTHGRSTNEIYKILERMKNSGL